MGGETGWKGGSKSAKSIGVGLHRFVRSTIVGCSQPAKFSKSKLFSQGREGRRQAVELRPTSRPLRENYFILERWLEIGNVHRCGATQVRQVYYCGLQPARCTAPAYLLFLCFFLPGEEEAGRPPRRATGTSCTGLPAPENCEVLIYWYIFFQSP